MNKSISNFVRRTLVPLLLILFCPPLVIVVWYTATALNGSLFALYEQILLQGPFSFIYHIWSPIFWGSKIAWTMIAVFAFFQLLFMRYLPGKTVYGPVTPKGNTPSYKANGVFSFLLTISLFLVSTWGLKLFSATLIFDHFGEILSALNILALVFCLFLCIKGYVAPSSSDAGSTGNPIFDYFWGTELYPRLAGWDVKMFTNCRFGMMSWGIIILSFAAKQGELYGLSSGMLVSLLLQLAYIFKFFIWEPGYMRSMDIMHDRAGYAICWGCLVWVPGIYTSVSLYLVHHPIHFPVFVSFLLLSMGLFCIFINYLADLQRQKIRATQGNCLIWKKRPQIIKARYTTLEGEKRSNLLLASGWWGISRHFHYLPEIAAAFLWTLPALFIHILPYFYVVFLTFLLVDRAARQEKRCASKYGSYWEEYRKKVPFKLIPYIY